MENLDEKLLEEELLKQHEKDQLEEMMLEEELLNQFENQLESTLNKFEVQVEEQLENLLPTIENQLFGEGNALTMALPSELGDALIGSTISGDSVLASVHSVFLLYVSVCDYLPPSSALYRFVSAPLSLCLFDGRRAFLVASRTVMHETFLVLWRSQIILIK
jgi:hypothetical protein